MSKFKVGDRVRVTDSTWVAVGTTGMVKGYSDSGNAAIETDQNTDGHGCRGMAREGHGWFIPDNGLELIDPPLAVGAKVKVVDEFDRYSGHIGTVENNDNSGWLEWHVRFDDGELHYYDARHLQVITGTAAPTTPAREFKAGDRIRAIAGDDGHFAAWKAGDEFVLAADQDGDLVFNDNDGDLRFFPAHEDKFVLADTPAAPASAPAANPLADLLAGFSATPSTGGGITFNLTINLPPGAITELLAAAKGA